MVNLFDNKFEIPLTSVDTDFIFKILDSQYARTIQSVYAPVHSDDGKSGRPFEYKYNKHEYISLLKRVVAIKPIVITLPILNIDTILEYYQIGIKSFMTSSWSEDLTKLPKDIILHRSIVGNSYNSEIDYRFDGTVIAYKHMMDVEYLRGIKNNNHSVTIIANHFCKASCSNLDVHLAYTLKDSFEDEFNISCPGGVPLFIPRNVIIKIMPYIDTIKLVDRVNTPEYYFSFIKHFLFNHKIIKTARDNEICNRVIDMASGSSMGSLDCRFNCSSCNNKCH